MMRAIVVMAKGSSRVKTRLRPYFEPAVVSKIYLCFLLDRIAQVEKIENAGLFLAYTPREAKSFFGKILSEEFKMICQKGKDLGERLANAADYAFINGFDKVILIDSDSPNLPRRNIYEAFEKLEKYDVVIGPCEDGGYYLIGLRTKRPDIFSEIPWSTPQVTTCTVMKAKKLRIKIRLLSRWYDVDTIEDMIHLKRDFECIPRVGEFGQYTSRLLSRNDIMRTLLRLNV